MSEEIDYKTGKFPFGPPMMCGKCKKKLQSKYRGEFVSCPCGTFVDQTGHYSRYGGNPVAWDEDMEEFANNPDIVFGDVSLEDLEIGEDD